MVASAAVTAAVVLAACGGGGGDKSAEVASLSGGATTTAAGSGEEASEEDFQEAMLDYAACMREHGVDMDDPQFDSDGRVTMRVGDDDEGDGAAGGSGPREDPDFAEAEEECRDIIESVRSEFQPDEEQQAEMQESLLAFAECMRAEGIDFPDPQFDSDGRPVFDAEEDRRMQFDPEDSGFQAAQEKCQEELGEGAGLRIGGPAGGGGGPQLEEGGGDEEGGD